MEPQSLETSTDYYSALLWLMGELGEAQASDAIEQFDRRLGDLVPAGDRTRYNSGQIRWEWEVRWARQALVGSGLMGSAGQGVWTITEAGQKWLQDHPDGGKRELSALFRGSYAARKQRSRPPQSLVGATTPLRNQVVGGLGRRGRRPRSKDEDLERPKAILAEEIRRIRGCLVGSLSAPGDEKLCDWVRFCYTFQLFDEGVALFRLVRPDAVHSWLYERTRKLARVCELRAKR